MQEEPEASALESETPMSAYFQPDAYKGQARPVLPEIVFGEPETITVADLKAGDFVVTIPAQGGFAAIPGQSGIKAISGIEYGRYTRKSGGRRVADVPSRRLEFLASGSPEVHVPAHFTVQVRRIAGEDETR
jgi:hypothetical protein